MLQSRVTVAFSYSRWNTLALPACNHPSRHTQTHTHARARTKKHTHTQAAGQWWGESVAGQAAGEHECRELCHRTVPRRDNEALLRHSGASANQWLKAQGSRLGCPARECVGPRLVCSMHRVLPRA